MDDRDLERWAEEVLGVKPEPIPAPTGFTDRVMARVTATSVESRPVPTWLLAASDPVAAVGLTAALVLAMLASWWPERLFGAAALVNAWVWNGTASLARNLDPAALLTLILTSALLIVAVLWRTWRAAERALILALTGRRGS
ncbi:MAG TPA: hypothetical protein VFR25_04505 [Candidatus Eisenbacteria bacterium]|nr:hypothetical protein [Candidatus Eisenbacteria bacterium]